MAAALARVVGGGAAARLSLAEMMGGRGARVAPRGLGVPRRPGLHARPARTTRTKTRLSTFVEPSIYGEGDCHISRVEIKRSPRERCIPSSFTTGTGACSTQRS